MRQASEPVLNVPPVVLATVAALVIVHVVRAVLPFDADNDFLLLFSFIPARYNDLLAGEAVPGGWAAGIWTFVTYALIHADLTHIGFNVVWLLPFGSALARRLGAARFTIFLLVTAAAGAAVHLATHLGEVYPMIGASAAISGTMAGTMRFAFQPGGPLLSWRNRDDAAYRVPAASLAQSFRDARFLVFLLAWFGLNALFGLGGLQLVAGQTVAWQAHIGGFLAGLLLFSLFDPVPRSVQFDEIA